MTPEQAAQDLEDALERAPVARLSRSAVPRELLVPPDLDDLIGMALRDWTILLVAWAGLAWTPAWAWPAWILIATSRLHAFGVILHDAAHQPLKRKTARLRLLEVLCGYPLATTVDAMRYHHLRHHRDNGMPSDPYFKAGVDRSWALWGLNVARGVALVPFWSVRAWFGTAARVLPALRQPYARVFLQDKSGEDQTESPEVLACARAELGQLLFQLPLWAATWAAPGALTLGYWVPVTLAGVLAAWRLLIEHRYTPAQDRRVETVLAITNDHHLGGWTAWLLAPRNIGYHVAHHLHPQVGLRHLPALRDWYRRQHPAYPEPR